MTLGNNIKKIRKLRGLTQEELAKEVGISRSYLGDVENDRKNLSYKTVESLAQKLNISMLYLNTGSDMYINLGYSDNVGKAINDKLTEIIKKEKENLKETEKIAVDFNFNEYDDITNRLMLALKHKKNILDDNAPIDDENAVFLLNLYRILERSRLKTAHLDKETHRKLLDIIALLLSNARDIDIDNIHKQITESETKKGKE